MFFFFFFVPFYCWAHKYMDRELYLKNWKLLEQRLTWKQGGTTAVYRHPVHLDALYNVLHATCM